MEIPSPLACASYVVVAAVSYHYASRYASRYRLRSWGRATILAFLAVLVVLSGGLVILGGLMDYVTAGVFVVAGAAMLGIWVAQALQAGLLPALAQRIRRRGMVIHETEIKN